MKSLDKKTTCVEIDEMSDDLVSELGLTDVTYSRPEFRHDCEMNHGYTLGYYRAHDGTIFRHDLMGDEEELNQVTAEEMASIKQNYEES